MTEINHGTYKFKNTCENPAALQARENPIAYSNLDTFSVATALVLNLLDQVLVRKIVFKPF